MLDPRLFLSPDNKNERRATKRMAAHLAIKVCCRGVASKNVDVSGVVNGASPTGFSCVLDDVIPLGTRFVSANIENGHGDFIAECVIAWRNDSERKYGLYFNHPDPLWWNTLTNLSVEKGWHDHQDRRRADRRLQETVMPDDKRKSERRFADLWQSYLNEQAPEEATKARILLRNKAFSYDPDVMSERREWLSNEHGVDLHHVASFSESAQTFKGKIENAIGVSHVPLGIAGPMKVNGEYARGTFYVPLATSEGALVTSYTLGMNIVTRSGGVNTKILFDEMRVTPVFKFDTLRQAETFVEWVKNNRERIKKEAERSTKHGKLLKLETLIDGHRVYLKFWYQTGDAMGMNMICKATEDACKMITSTVKPSAFYLRSNYSSNKKISHANIITGYGKTVTADVIIPKRLIQMLDVSPEEMQAYYQETVQSSLHAGMIGANGHFANGLTALFIACGQDVATIANCSAGISFCEVNSKGDLYVSVYIPNMLIGTVGGGTGFGTAKECLGLMDCVGNGKARKFAEIAAATALAGEVSICAAVVNGTYVEAHELYGRNRPQNMIPDNE